ncbi:MAG: hypothetical protein WAU67_08765, partial [Terracidiphilus sp.]
ASFSPVESTTGKESGKRTAQRTSCLPLLVTGPCLECADSGFEKFMRLACFDQPVVNVKGFFALA